MTTTPNASGPGTRLLAEQLGLGDPLTALAVRHAPGEHLYRLARALCQTASELDAAYAWAQQTGRELRNLRGRHAAGTEELDAGRREIGPAAAELELALERCEVMDTALIRLLGVYQDLGSTLVPGEGSEQRDAWRLGCRR